MFHLPAFASLILFLTSPLLLAQNEPAEKIVAIVNDEPILFSELQTMADRLIDEMKRTGKAKELGTREETERRVLDQMINDKLIEAEIVKQGLSAEENVIDGAVESVMKQNGFRTLEDLKKALRDEGLSLEDYRESLKKQIENSRLLNTVVKPRVQVTEQDVESAYRQRTSDSPKKWQSKVRMIFKKKDPKKDVKKAMERLLREMNAGIPFERIADRETEGPGKGEGGNIGFVSPSDLQPELGKALEQLEPGQMSKVVEVKNGYYLIESLEKREMEPESVGHFKKGLQEQLTKAELEKQFDAYIRELRAKSHVVIR